MTKKKTYLIVFFILSMMLVNFNIKAFSDTIGPINQSGGVVKYNNLDELALKYYDNTAVFCTQFKKTTPAGKNLSCSKINDWDEKTSVAIAAIITSVGTFDIGGNAPENYYYAELAINKFLCDKRIDIENTCKFGERNVTEILGEYDKLYYNANTAYDNYAGGVSISFSGSELSFTKQGDNYVSNSVTIDSSERIGYDIKSNVGAVRQEGNSFYVTVPINEATNLTNVTVTGKVSKSFKIAQQYSCGEYQNITPNYLETKTIEATTSISGTIKPKGKIIINKIDNNNNPLSGARILVQGPNNYQKQIDTKGNAIILENLEYGKYSIDETVVPDGYLKAEAITVELNENNLSQTINLIDNPIKISILKVDETGKTLKRATLKLTDKDGKLLKICGQNNNEECKWITTENEYVIEKIPSGTYYIKELSAPDTYSVSKKSVKVIVTGDGVITVDGKDIKGETIKFVNELTRTEISKVNAVDGKELPGATLQILDSNKEKMSCVILNKNGKKENLKECTWVSGEESTIVVGLANGKYYLKETLAPEGYVLNEEMVEFEVTGDGVDKKVVMENDLEVKVPDTLSARSTLLIAISMFDIALGIGILTYVKKYKTEE